MSITADLSKRTAVVTGASSGIGRAVAERLGAAGAHVVLSGRTESAMHASAERITKAGGKATVRVSDVRQPAAVQALVDVAVERTGRLDIMVNNAGIAVFQPILQADPEQWRALLETNVLAVLVGCQAAARAMRACGAQGHIVNISSVAALRSGDGSVYGATKHAVNAISNSLREELAGDSIQVVTIMPGGVATNFARHFDPAIVQQFAAMTGLQADFKPGERLPDELLETVQARLADYLASPDDIADAVLYAVSQPARINVSEIVVRPSKELKM